jgi:ribosomal protein S18 acetylase RimI-like enzyme
VNVIRLHEAGDELVRLLIDTVASGASIGWVRTPSREAALAFWQSVAASTARGERLWWGLEHEGRLLGSAQLLLDQAENGQHRAEVCKVMVHPDARRQGIGEALMRTLETEARVLGKRLLVLDTNTDSAAQRLYTRLGFELCGVMPGYAEQADGSLGASSWMFKRL